MLVQNHGSIIQQLRALLVCNSCKNSFSVNNQPRIINCGHSICSNCSINNLQTHCKLCEQSNNNSDNLIGTLPINLELNSVLQILQDYDNASPQTNVSKMHCEEHSIEKSYCTTCYSIFCGICEDHVIHPNEIVSLGEIHNRLESLLTEGKSQISSMEEEMEFFQKILSSHTTAMNAIDRYYQEKVVRINKLCEESKERFAKQQETNFAISQVESIYVQMDIAISSLKEVSNSVNSFLESNQTFDINKVVEFHKLIENALGDVITLHSKAELLKSSNNLEKITYEIPFKFIDFNAPSIASIPVKKNLSKIFEKQHQILNRLSHVADFTTGEYKLKIQTFSDRLLKIYAHLSTEYYKNVIEMLEHLHIVAKKLPEEDREDLLTHVYLFDQVITLN